jgi:hypothetical protein
MSKLKIKVMLLLEDLKNKTEAEVKSHLVNEYTADPDVVDGLEVLIGYESVGDWGCDSSSFFLLRDKDGNLFEVHGSHCSCYGFEDQFTLEPTTIEALKFRINESYNHSVFYTGGYDNNENENIKAATEYILSYGK